MRRMISICLTWLPIGGLREPNIYHDLGDLTRIADFTWRVSDCEELVGVQSQGNDGGCFRGVIVLSISHSPTFF